MDRISTVKQILEAKFQESEIEVYDLAEGQDYLGIKVSSPAFIGKSLLEQHRMVMEVVKEPLKDDLHAVQIKTKIKTL